MRFCTVILLFAATEWLRFFMLLKKYGNFMEEDPLEMMSRMPLAEIVRMKGTLISAITLTIMAQMAWWLP